MSAQHPHAEKEGDAVVPRWAKRHAHPSWLPEVVHGDPVAMPPGEIGDLPSLVVVPSQARTVRRFVPGDTVRILRGAYSGCVGTVVQPEPDSEYPVAVRIETDELSPQAFDEADLARVFTGNSLVDLDVADALAREHASEAAADSLVEVYERWPGMLPDSAARAARAWREIR